MSTYLRQVTKEEYDILTRFHPGEIRYYVDVGVSKYRKRPAVKKATTRGPRVVGASSNGDGRTLPKNSPMQLVTTAHQYKEGTLSLNLYRLVKLKFENDPTKVIGRTDLVNSIVHSSIYAANQVGPFVSDCLKKGVLRYSLVRVRDGGATPIKTFDRQ